ncbi:uncharacterized protein LOC126670770 [Mercurialis annua]|uniref:uncharacterized protein LOC126670770 n=1 Tax=Mercurialis annua TaxID=3986 RepID=UPI0024AE4443|nr:uncharacterized protein LOC126670770 [Mercurialis annua]
MATLNLSFVIWCDGRMVSSPAGVEYQGGRRADMPIIDRMNFEELRNICIRAVATDSEVEITKIYFRLPKIESGRIVSYSLYSVENNEHIFGILRETMRYRGLDTLEFYVEYRTVVCHDVSVDQLVLSESSGSEIGSDEDEDDEEDFFGCEEEAEEQEDCNDHDSGEDTVYQSQLPEGFNHVNLDDFDVAPESDENLMWNPGMEFQVGMIFPNRASVQACATAYSVENGREHKSRRTTNYTVVFACRYNPICKWWLRATLLQATHTWTCTKYIGPHTCNELVPNANHRNFGAREIAKYVRREVMEQRDIRVNTLIAGIWDEHRVRPPYKRMWYAKEKAIASVYGDWYESFGCINDIMHNIVHVNPGSFWHAEGDDVYINGMLQPNIRTFVRMFWTFFPMVAGFRFCKPVLFVDGTHLYGRYKMTMLIASAIDGNSHIMPVAFAIVESESTESYEYFLGHLREQVILGRKVSIISDRHAGILAVLRRPEWADVPHKFCIRHLASNFNTHFRDKSLKKLMEKAGRAYQKKKYKRYMEVMRIKSPEGYAWLTDEHRPKEKWSRAHDHRGQRHNVMTTNYAESVNATLRNIRGLPISSMLETLIKKLVDMFVRRRTTYSQLIAKGVQYTPILDHILKKRVAKARHHTSQTYDRTTIRSYP